MKTALRITKAFFILVLTILAIPFKMIWNSEGNLNAYSKDEDFSEETPRFDLNKGQMGDYRYTEDGHLK